MNDERESRTPAEETKTGGELPAHRPDRVWGGLGCGAPCALCDETLDAQEVELELQFAASGDATYHVHAECFAAWELERRNGGSNGHSLPHAVKEGMMAVDERSATSDGDGG